MKVVLLIDSLGPGGAERSTAAIATELVACGVDVHLVVLYRAEEGYEDEIRRSGARLTVLEHQGFIGRVRELRSLLRHERPEVLHTCLFAADQVGRVAAAGLRTTVISSWVRAPLTRSHLPPAVKPWKHAVVTGIDTWTGRLLVDHFHAVSSGVARLHEQLRRVSPSKVTVVERGRRITASHDTEVLRRTVREGLGVGASTPVVLAAGRIEHEKAHIDLVRSMPLVLERHPAAVLLIAGRDGNAAATLRTELAARPQLDSHVRLLGHRVDVLDLLRACDVMALPSHAEGTAGIALEAMAVGAPIVSTRLEGMEGILHHERNALVVDIGDLEGLAGAITRLLDDPALGRRLAAAARLDFEQRFTIERCAERTIAMYEDVLASTGRSRD